MNTFLGAHIIIVTFLMVQTEAKFHFCLNWNFGTKNENLPQSEIQE